MSGQNRPEKSARKSATALENSVKNSVQNPGVNPGQGAGNTVANTVKAKATARAATREITDGITDARSLPDDRLWTQREAAHFLGVSARYLRDSSCPKILLPGNGEKGQPLVRYDPAEVRAWMSAWHTSRVKRIA
jgi:hypothetical protein